MSVEIGSRTAVLVKSGRRARASRARTSSILRALLLLSVLAGGVGCVGDQATTVTYGGTRYFGGDANAYDLSRAELRRIGVAESAVRRTWSALRSSASPASIHRGVIVVRSDYTGVEQDMVFWRERIEYPQELCPFVRDTELPESCRDR